MTATNRPPSVYVDDVFEEVLALEPDERDAAIEARCAGHPSLAAEVRALLHAEESQEPPPADQIVAGARLGRYTLDACLGKGASASVWKAWDTHLRTWTALKLLRPDLKRREDALHTVLHEARAASAIISDHVVRIKAAGKLAAGPYYVEMKLCAEYQPDTEGEEDLVIGRTLAEERPRSVREAARLVMEAARGVESAHRVGVMHRDIKPANILLTPVSRRALVADFGLSAAHLYPAPGPGTPSTATITVHLHDGRGMLVGTPSFMPPEQAWGEPASRACDVYALGATLYALVARRAPYQPKGERPLPALDVVRMVRDAPPKPLRAVAERVPGQLLRIVERAMHRDAARRYPTAAALADDLEQFLALRPTTVDGRRPWLNAGLFIRRQWPMVAAGWLLTLMLGSVGLLEYRRVQLTHENALAEQQVLEARKEARMADAERTAAELGRDRAVAAKGEADAAREAAEEARAKAEQGMDAAALQVARATKAREDAEASALAAEEAKTAAEEEAQRQRKVRASLEEELQRARESYAAAATRVDTLAAQLAAQVETNAELEGDVAALGEQLMDARARVARLETELDLLDGVDVVDDQTGDPSAPWMDPDQSPTEPAPEPSTPSLEAAP